MAVFADVPGDPYVLIGNGLKQSVKAVSAQPFSGEEIDIRMKDKVNNASIKELGEEMMSFVDRVNFLKAEGVDHRIRNFSYARYYCWVFLRMVHICT